MGGGVVKRKGTGDGARKSIKEVRAGERKEE